MNRVELIGGITRPIEIEFTDKGTPFARVTLAVPEVYYDGERDAVRTHYVSCSFWSRQAVALQAAEISVGEKLWVLGSIDQSTYEKDGKKISKTRVRVHVWDRLQPKEVTL